MSRHMHGRFALAFWYGRCAASVTGPLSASLADDAVREMCIAMQWSTR
jgi:hypothetical protein